MRVAGRVGRRGKCQTLLFLFGTRPARKPARNIRALAEGRTPDGGRSEERTPKAFHFRFVSRGTMGSGEGWAR